MTNTPTINVDEELWKAIKQAASESNWIPKEYYINDWVSDVCEFLKNGHKEGEINTEGVATTEYNLSLIVNQNNELLKRMMLYDVTLTPKKQY